MTEENQTLFPYTYKHLETDLYVQNISSETGYFIDVFTDVKCNNFVGRFFSVDEFNHFASGFMAARNNLHLFGAVTHYPNFVSAEEMIDRIGWIKWDKNPPYGQRIVLVKNNDPSFFGIAFRSMEAWHGISLQGSNFPWTPVDKFDFWRSVPRNIGFMMSRGD